MSEAQLRDRIEYLEAEVAMLRGELGQSKTDEHLTLARQCFNIQPHQARLLLLLIDSRPRTHGTLITLLWGDDEPESNVLNKHISVLRGALRSHDIAIGTIWGHGYQMAAADCAKVKAILGIEAKP